MPYLASNPPAIIIVNNDLTEQVQGVLVRQLRIDQVMDGYTFDQTIAADPNWPNDIRAIHNQRIMVIRDLRELDNREHADIVAFVSHGLISTEKNKFGPPLTHFQVRKIHWGQLCHYVKQKGPGNIATTCCSCGTDITCTIRAELDALNRRICSTCCSCGSCCNCPQPTYRTLLVPHLPDNPVRGV